MKRELDELALQQLVRGSALLMHEGRDWRDQASRLARMALRSGKVRLHASAAQPGIFVSAALHGHAVDDRDWELLPADLGKASHMLHSNLSPQRTVLIGQFAANGGPLAAVLAAAISGTPLLDATWGVGQTPAARGVAHVVAGGNRAHQRYIEWFSRETDPLSSPLLTSTMATVGGYYAHVQQVADTDIAALQAGGLSRTIALGAQLYRAEKKGAAAVVSWLENVAGYRLLGQGQLLPSAMVLGAEGPRRLLQLQQKRQKSVANYWLDEQGRLHDTGSGVFGQPLWVSAQGELLQEDEIWRGDLVSLLVPTRAQAAVGVLPVPVQTRAAGYSHPAVWATSSLAQAS